MNRRDFGKWVAMGLAANVVPACSAQNLPKPAASPPPGPNVPVLLSGVPRGGSAEDLSRAVRAAAEAATDFSWLSKGETVLVKPASNSGNPYPATTSPIAIRAMVEVLREKGAGRVIICDQAGIELVRQSRDGVRGSTRELMRQNGIAEAAEVAGAEVHCFEEQGWEGYFEDFPATGAHWKTGIRMPRILKEADHLVLMPRCSRHVLAGSTLGLKAAVGWWRADSRLEYHHDASTFHEKTAEANTVPSLREKLRLVLSAATQVLATFGPDKGRAVEPEVGLVIASQSIVAHDMASLAWLLETREMIPASEREGMIDDPNSSSLVVDLGNRVVVRWLGGVGKAVTAEKLARHDVQEVWEDPALRRAFEVLGGAPQVDLIDPADSIPIAMRQALASRLGRPV